MRDRSCHFDISPRFILNSTLNPGATDFMVFLPESNPLRKQPFLFASTDAPTPVP
ncbi:MAG: hypothetical protein GXP09_04000 [Gammaproteobacteria bacterium]|nr:hypothetical protein [Gammaproteobacteria bacterium]